MQVVLDSNITCYEPVAELQSLQANNLPIPQNLAKANQFFNPLGPAPGRGWVCLLAGDFDAKVQKNQLHTLKFKEGANVILLRNLVLTGSRAITPGAPYDKTTTFLVEFADQRHQLANEFMGVPCNKQYNVRAPAYTLDGTEANRYYADSLNAGALWTWQTMVTDLWNLMPQLGPNDTIPVNPDGSPEEFKFPGVSAYVALNQVLKRLGCAIKWNGQATDDVGQYSIVQIGAEDGPAERAIGRAENEDRLIYDAQFVDDVIFYGRVPGRVQVCFHKMYDQYGSEETVTRTAAQPQTQMVYTLDVGAPTSVSSFADPDVTHVIWDELPAIYDYSGAQTNSAALEARAQDRADTFYKMVNGIGADRMQKIFTGVVSVQPGSTIKGVRWGADMFGIAGPPGGMITEVVRHPFYLLEPDESPGGWACCDDMMGSSNNQPPNLEPTLPVYPHYMQNVMVSNGTASANGVFPGNVLRFNGTSRVLEVKEECRLKELNGCTAVAAANYHGRLSGFDPEGFPTYTIRYFANGGGNGGGNSNVSITYENSTVTFDANSTLTINKLIQTANTSNVTSDKNNWVLGNQTLHRANVTANACVSGIQAGSDGQLREIQNVGNSILRFLHESTDSAAANRIWTVDGQDWYIMANCSIGMKYVASASRWEMLWPTGRDVSAKLANSANVVDASTEVTLELLTTTYNTGLRDGNFGFTAPVTGKYILGFNIQYNMTGGNTPTTGGTQFAWLTVGGVSDNVVTATLVDGTGVFAAACAGTMNFEQVYSLAAGTAVRLKFYNNDSANSVNVSSRLWGQKVDKAG